MAGYTCRHWSAHNYYSWKSKVARKIKLSQTSAVATSHFAARPLTDFLAKARLLDRDANFHMSLTAWWLRLETNRQTDVFYSDNGYGLFRQRNERTNAVFALVWLNRLQRAATAQRLVVERLTWRRHGSGPACRGCPSPGEGAVSRPPVRACSRADRRPAPVDRRSPPSLACRQTAPGDTAVSNTLSRWQLGIFMRALRPARTVLRLARLSSALPELYFKFFLN